MCPSTPPTTGWKKSETILPKMSRCIESYKLSAHAMAYRLLLSSPCPCSESTSLAAAPRTAPWSGKSSEVDWYPPLERDSPARRGVGDEAGSGGLRDAKGDDRSSRAESISLRVLSARPGTSAAARPFVEIGGRTADHQQQLADDLISLYL